MAQDTYPPGKSEAAAIQSEKGEEGMWSERRLDMANVVVAADRFNPSILSESWLVANDIITTDAKIGDWLFSPMVANVPTEEFTIVAVPERFQFTLKNPTGDVQKLIEEKVGKIVELLPHTPYRALGLNFTWIAITNDIDGFAAILHEKFVKEDSPLYDEFSGPAARFGAYLSKDALGFRLRLDIKPIAGERDGMAFEGLAFHFNFNQTLAPDTAVQQIWDALGRWDEARNLSSTLFKNASGWVGNA